MSTVSTPEAEAPLEDQLTASAKAARLARAEALVKNYVLGSAAIALVPVPVVDLTAALALALGFGLAFALLLGGWWIAPEPLKQRLSALPGKLLA